MFVDDPEIMWARSDELELVSLVVLIQASSFKFGASEVADTLLGNILYNRIKLHCKMPTVYYKQSVSAVITHN